MKPAAILFSLSFTLCVAGQAAGDFKAGKVAYDRACKSCHGLDGTPNANIAKAMKVEMRHLGDKEVQATSDAEMKKIILEGHGKMKPTKGVSDKEADDVLTYLKMLKK